MNELGQSFSAIVTATGGAALLAIPPLVVAGCAYYTVKYLDLFVYKHRPKSQTEREAEAWFLQHMQEVRALNPVT